MSKDKVRVYQLAKDLDVDSRRLIDLLTAAGTDVKNHMTTLDATTRQLAQDLLSGKVRPEKVNAAAQATAAPPRATPTIQSEPATQDIPDPRAKRPTTIPPQRAAARTADAPRHEAVEVLESPSAEAESPLAEEAETHLPEMVAEQEAVVVDEPAAETPVVHEPAVDRPEVASVEEPIVGTETELGPIPTRDSKPKAIPPVQGEGVVQSEGRGARTTRDRRRARTTPVVLAPSGARSRSELAKKKPEIAAQKPVMKLPESMLGGQPPTGDLLRQKKASEEAPAESGKKQPGQQARGRGAAPRQGGTVLNRDERQRRRGQRAAARRRDGSDGGDEHDLRRRSGRSKRRAGQLQSTGPKGPVVLEAPVTVRSFSLAAGIRANELQRRLMSLGVMATINAALSEEDAELLATELDLVVTFKRSKTADSMLEESFVVEEGKPEDLVSRPPVVTFMGHVDHGKTSLMDRIREANVAGGESGGITQHIGAYQAKTAGGIGRITFLDTPGHEAFTEMRARGANVTDFVVLVIAADDGIMPQTEEAINHAKAADVPIVVALNKIDLPNANVEKIQQQLSAHGLIAEAWGGDTLMVGTSATVGTGVDELLEALALVAELKDLKSNPNRPASGACIEASLSEGHGVMATLLVRDGTLRKGDIALCGTAFGRVRAMFDDHNRPLEEAGPSTPVVVAGLDEVPQAGEKFFVLDDLAKAREISEQRKFHMRDENLATAQPQVSLENLFDRLKENQIKDLLLIVKADVRGSLEAIHNELGKFDHDEVRVRIIHEGVGGISESDVLLAAASNAIIIGFRVVADDRAHSLASEKSVDVRRYEVIYNVTDDIRKALEGMLTPEAKEVRLGRAVVQEVFTISRMGAIAGCRVIEGTIERNCKIRIIRDGTIVGVYTLDSLRRVKDDVKEVRDGMECGMKLAGFNDLKRQDVLEAFKIEQIKRTL